MGAGVCANPAEEVTAKRTRTGSTGARRKITCVGGTGDVAAGIKLALGLAVSVLPRFYQALLSRHLLNAAGSWRMRKFGNLEPSVGFAR